MLSPTELARFNTELDLSPSFENAFDTLLETWDVRDKIYDTDRFEPTTGE